MGALPNSGEQRGPQRDEGHIVKPVLGRLPSLPPDQKSQTQDPYKGIPTLSKDDLPTIPNLPQVAPQPGEKLTIPSIGNATGNEEHQPRTLGISDKLQR